MFLQIYKQYNEQYLMFVVLMTEKRFSPAGG